MLKLHVLLIKIYGITKITHLKTFKTVNAILVIFYCKSQKFVNSITVDFGITVNF